MRETILLFKRECLTTRSTHCPVIKKLAFQGIYYVRSVAMYPFVNAFKNSYHNSVDSIVFYFKMLMIVMGKHDSRGSPNLNFKILKDCSFF